MLLLAGHLLLITLALGGTPPPVDEPRANQYEQIVAQHAQEEEAASQATKAAQTDDERRAVQWPARSDCAERLLKLAEAQPSDETARRSALWLLHYNVEMGFEGKYVPLAARACNLLLRFHKDDEAVGAALLPLASSPFLTRDRLLPAMFEQTTNRLNQGRACFALAQYLKNKASFAQYLRHPDYPAADSTWYLKVYGAPYLATLKAVDPAPLLAESERLYERVLDEFATLEHLPHQRHPGQTRTLGELARNDLDELRHLAVGQPAPEIEGEDIGGVTMKLSDLRGKVVVLVFWGTWCGSCMVQVPHEKELVARLRGRPFALVGVNSDTTRAEVQTTTEREGITWRSWFDGGMAGGPIARRWNIPHWPVVHVIDHRGVIRARNVHDDAFLDRLVDDLVIQAEQAAPPLPRTP